jgi:acetyl esterase/lipase
MALKAPRLETPVLLRMQLLLVPVIDNTTNSVWYWSKNWHAPGLGPLKMAWYWRLYIRNRNDGKRWEASPHLAPSSLIRRVAKASIMVSEVDILNGEGVNYAKLLEKNGVSVTLKEYNGAPHMLMAMGGGIESARILVQDTISALKVAFMTADK